MSVTFEPDDDAVSPEGAAGAAAAPLGTASVLIEACGDGAVGELRSDAHAERISVASMAIANVTRCGIIVTAPRSFFS